VVVASTKPVAAPEIDLRTVFADAFDDGQRDCRAARGDREARLDGRPAYDPWRARQHPDYGEALIEAYESGWRSAL
jgi:hypothetical protein